LIRTTQSVASRVSCIADATPPVSVGIDVAAEPRFRARSSGAVNSRLQSPLARGDGELPLPKSVRPNGRRRVHLLASPCLYSRCNGRDRGQEKLSARALAQPGSYASVLSGERWRLIRRGAPDGLLNGSVAAMVVLPARTRPRNARCACRSGRRRCRWCRRASCPW
jgi:hypothetical protein